MLLVLYEANILQRDLLAGGKKAQSLQTLPVVLLKTKEPCSVSYVLIKGLIKSFLQLNEYLISQRAAIENCDETQRTN